MFAVGQNVGILCLEFGSESTALVNWDTNALSANLSNRIEQETSSFSSSELFLTGVDSGYCGTYMCTFIDSGESTSVSITVGKYRHLLSLLCYILMSQN